MDLTNVSYNTADVLAIGSLVVSGLAIIWGVRKAISLAGR